MFNIDCTEINDLSNKLDIQLTMKDKSKKESEKNLLYNWF